MRYLRLSYDRHEDVVMAMTNDPSFRSLHDQSAYQEIVARVGLPKGN